MTPRLRGALRRKLLAWYRAHRRDLPWRRTRDPYAIWISEAMLQQTRVETVIPYYERFLARFPDVEALATADADDVIALWAGLGYYSRARNLHRAAQVVMERHAGRLPDDVDLLRELPGVGRYTAGALASIAFDKPAPIVDGNVARVLARLLGIDADVRSREVQERLWSEAEQLARGEDPGALNQALMELGAVLCTPRAPRCPACPWTRALRRARAGQRGGAARAVAPGAACGAWRRWRSSSSDTTACWRCSVRSAACSAGSGSCPAASSRDGEPPARALARALREGVGLGISAPEPLGAIEHAFTHRLLRLHVYRAKAGAGRVRRIGWDAHRWVSQTALAALPLGGPTRKALARVAGGATVGRVYLRRVSSRFGHTFQITTFGESHGGAVGVVVDGCPPRLPLDAAEIQRDLDRRRPGQSSLTTPRQEEDRVEILSGVFEGVTLGTPIGAPRAQSGRAAERLRAHEGRLPALARRLHHRAEVRRPQLAGRRPRERARDGRPGRGGRDRAQAARDRGRRGSARVGASRARRRGEDRSGRGDARGGRGESGALPRRGRGGRDGRA